MKVTGTILFDWGKPDENGDVYAKGCFDNSILKPSSIQILHNAVPFPEPLQYGVSAIVTESHIDKDGSRVITGFDLQSCSIISDTYSKSPLLKAVETILNHRQNLNLLKKSL